LLNAVPTPSVIEGDAVGSKSYARSVEPSSVRIDPVPSALRTWAAQREAFLPVTVCETLSPSPPEKRSAAVIRR
jgi:hypothetical protein